MGSRNFAEFKCDNKHQAKETKDEKMLIRCAGERSLLYSDEIEGVVFNVKVCIDLVVLLRFFVWPKRNRSTITETNAVAIYSLSLSFFRRFENEVY